MNVTDSRYVDGKPHVAETHGYPFPRHFLYFELLLFSLISTLMIFAWIPALMSLITYSMVLPSAVRAAIFLNITAVALLLFVFFIKREMRNAVFLLTDEFLVQKGAYRTRKIRLAAIRKVSLIRFPVTGGAMVLECDHGVLAVPLLLLGVHNLAERLERFCASAAHGCSTDEKTWRRIHEICSTSHAVNRRTAVVFRPLLTLSVFMLPVNVIVGAGFWDMSILPLMLWAVSGPLFPGGAYAVADILMRRRGRRDFSAAAVSSEEQRTIARSALLFFLLYLAAGIIYKACIL